MRLTLCASFLSEEESLIFLLIVKCLKPSVSWFLSSFLLADGEKEMLYQLPYFKYHSLWIVAQQQSLNKHSRSYLLHHLFWQNTHLRLKLTSVYSFKHFLTLICIGGYNSNSCGFHVNILGFSTQYAIAALFFCALSVKWFPLFPPLPSSYDTFMKTSPCIERLLSSFSHFFFLSNSYNYFHRM